MTNDCIWCTPFYCEYTTLSQDDGPEEEDQYAQIDFNDMNGDVPVPGQQYPNPMASVPFSNMTASVHNVHHPNGAVGAPSVNAQQSIAAGHNMGMHVKNQTGSNYDELPLEFITNIPANQAPPAVNGYNGGGSNLDIIASAAANASGGGYQEIEFNDDVDVASSVPSQNSSYANLNGNVC